MSTEVIAPPVAPNSASEFEARFAEEKQKEVAAPSPETPETTPAPEPTKEKPPQQEIPDEILTGKKSEAPAKPDAQKTEIDRVLESELPPSTPEKQKSNWRMLKDELKSTRSILEQKDAELAELRGKVGQPNEMTAKEVSELKKAIAERDELLERTAYEKSPAYQRFEAREKRVLEQAKGYIDGTGIDPHVIDIAANQSGKKRIDTLKEAGLDSETIAAITPYLANLDDTRSEKMGALENWKVNSERQAQEAKIQAERAEQAQMEKETKTMREMHRSAAERWGAYKKVEGQDAWNQRVDQRLDVALEYLHGNKPVEELCDVILAGVAAKDVQTINDRLRAQVKELTEKVSALTAVQPGNGTVNGAAKPAVSNKFDPAQSASEFDRRLSGV